MRSMLIIGATLDDARDFIGRDFMGRIDNVAPRKLAIPDEIWPRDETMTAEFCTPDTIPMRAFDIVVLTASLWGPPSTLYSLARARTKTDGLLWRETPPRISMPPNGAAERCLDCGAAEGGSFTHDNGQRLHVNCPNGPGGRTLGRIAKFTATPGERVQVPLPSRECAAAGTFTPGGSFTVPIDGEL